MIDIFLCILIALAACIYEPALAVAQEAPALKPRPASNDPVPVMSESQAKAKRLWDSLSDDDRAFVKGFISRENIRMMAPDLLSLRSSGRNSEAITMIQRIYKIDDPARAEVILKLLAYAYDQD